MEFAGNQEGKVIRVPQLKRGKEDVAVSERVKLERVLGLTVTSNAALACDPNTGTIAYPAGCAVVLFNPRKNRQTHIVNPSRKTLTAVAFSADGKYLVTGECGHQPSVRIWDLADRSQVAEFAGHKFGVVCAAFSPNHKYVVSVGSQHDMIVNVWDWRSGVKVASNKVSSKVKAVSFAENGSYFVTVGNRHVKFWYLEYSRSAKYKEPVPLMGRSAILGEQRNNYFCDVGCGRGEMGDSTYAITKTGLLCEFNNRRLLDKWVELRTSSANCLVVGEQHIFVGCADGIVRCFSPFTLQFVTTLPRTHYLGVDVAKGLSISHMASHPANAKYPDTVALTYDETNHKVACVYSDRSLYLWDITDIRKVGKSHSFLYHAACIWGVESYPSSKEGMKGVLPTGSFVTCSSDDTIRVWNLDPNMGTNTIYRRNIYSNDLLKTLYVDQELAFLKDQDLAAGGSSDKTDSTYDARNGVRCIRISPDGKHLASGDRAGNIRIHDMQFMDQLYKIEAHDSEVLSLEYSKPESGLRLLASASRDRLIHIFSVDQGYSFVQTLDDHSSSITSVRFVLSHGLFQMVSCGADKSLIFRQLQQANGNSQVQFARGHNIVGKTTFYDMESDQSQKHILTACQDRSVRVYNTSTGKHSKTFKGSNSDDGTLIKLCLDSSGLYVATSCTDKTLAVYDYYSGECMATMYGHSELVTGLRFTNDGKHLVSVSGDGCVFIWKLPHDMTVTVQARLTQQSARAAKESRRATYNTHGGSGSGGPLSPDLKTDNEEFGSPPPELFDPNANANQQGMEEDYRFSVGQLPLWAKKQIGENNPPKPGSNSTNKGGVDLPKGRWAQRMDTTNASGITVKSFYQGDSVIPFPPSQMEKGNLADSDGSKDSSLESNEFRSYGRNDGTFLKENEPDEFVPCPASLDEIERASLAFQIPTSKITRRGGESSAESGRGRTLTDDSSASSLKMEDFEGTEHDGDVEDYSDNESTEPEQTEKLMYYPQNEETSSDYTVNAMDVEELRRSQRRVKKPRSSGTDLGMSYTLNPPSSTVSVSGSQDSEDDDDEISTPSGELAERNLLSLLSVSSESLDRVGRRESYLKSNFESLGGQNDNLDMTVVSAETEDGSPFNKSNLSSLTSKFLTKSNSNADMISAVKATQRDPEAARKREELQRRIEETRRKLQSIGYKSNLRNSQSITDLRESGPASLTASPTPNMTSSGSVAGGGGGGTFDSSSAGGRMWGSTKDRVANDGEADAENGTSGLRRACSLSDLSKPSPRRLLPSPPNNVSGKVSRPAASTPQQTQPQPQKARQFVQTQPVKRTSLRPAVSTDLTRSSSMGFLNQANDSDSELKRPQSSASGSTNLIHSNRGSLTVASGVSKSPSFGSISRPSSTQSAMRPTISSANKAAAMSGSKVGGSNSGGTPMKSLQTTRRISSAVSTGDIQQALHDSSSSEEAGGTEPKTNVKARVMSFEKTVGGRSEKARSVLFTPSPKTNPARRSLFNSPVTSASSSTPGVGAPRSAPSTPSDNGPSHDANKVLSRASCELAIETMKASTEQLLLLQRRLAGGTGSSEGSESNLSDRERAELLQLLSTASMPIIQSLKTLQFPPAGIELDRLANATSPQPNENNPLMVQMMQQYSDMLLSMIHQRMGVPAPPSPR
ncbi:mitogen-activated protein kinase-binding protein 1-like isoform X3 [Daphnia pulicaria]|uniref:mitogen-activated protein kinase-binding protein 1-like isoform X3 n=1 Tax=Daphnia pulicaria TaxID=35523 RepID=UPI001EEBAEC3|nr:mitogen-activated protein kinase-binding protein 1-like isoform X3 [Daphnia pulicaria]XP_046630858.1 mitogen-activated protein kinase-binding protein 1-like isoform X3 [Daphnia pulicaria]